MTLPMFVLAQQNTDADSATSALSWMWNRMDFLNHPEELLDGLAQLNFVHAAVFVAVGLVCVLNGYRWHRWVIVILSLLAGILLGRYLSQTMGQSQIIAIALGILLAVVATPMLKIAVAVFGGLTGAFIGANAWTAVNVAQADAHWAGAAMGFIVLAMASFILFKLVIIAFTSIGGAALLVFGVITAILQVESWAPAVTDHLASNRLLIPVLVLTAAACGFVLQQSQPAASAEADD